MFSAHTTTQQPCQLRGTDGEDKLHGSLPAAPQVKSALRLGVGPPPPARSPTAGWEHLAKNRSHSEQWVVALLWWGVVCAWRLHKWVRAKPRKEERASAAQGFCLRNEKQV